jgi:hypothetical protein
MSVIAIATKHLIAAGVTGDALIAAIAEIEDATNELFATHSPVIEPLSARQERNRRYYEKRLNASEKRLNASETSESVLKVSPPSPPLSSPPFLSPTPPNLTPPIIPPTTTPSKRSQASSDGFSVRAILGACLSETSIDDLIEHRRRKKSPMTARAAKELVKQFTEFGDPERAVATMIIRGWTGFEPGWMDNPARAGPKIVRQSCFETSRPYMGR